MSHFLRHNYPTPLLLNWLRIWLWFKLPRVQFPCLSFLSPQKSSLTRLQLYKVSRFLVIMALKSGVWCEWEVLDFGFFNFWFLSLIIVNNGFVTMIKLLLINKNNLRHNFIRLGTRLWFQFTGDWFHHCAALNKYKFNKGAYPRTFLKDLGYAPLLNLYLISAALLWNWSRVNWNQSQVPNWWAREVGSVL